MVTSGEIRVHTEPHCKGNVLDRAADLFYKLKMQETAQRNGVLIYIAYKDRKLAIVGDKGINDVVPDDFWDSTFDVMTTHFKRGDFLRGTIYGIGSGDQITGKTGSTEAGQRYGGHAQCR